MLNGALSRPSAFSPRRRLDPLFARAPITVVHGARGSGKTTAVAAWSRSVGSDGIWIDVADGSAGDAVVWGRLAAHLHARNVSGSAAAPPSTPVPRDDAERMLGGALTGFRIVVDGADRLEPAIVDDLARLVDRLPSIQIVLIGRVIPAGRTLSDVSRAIAIVSAEQLVLTVEDVRDVLRAAAVSASAGVVSWVATVTGGLPLLVAVVARALGGRQLAGDRPSAVHAGLVIDAIERVAMTGGTDDLGAALPILQAASLLNDANPVELATVADVSVDQSREALLAAERAGWGAWFDGTSTHQSFAFDPVVAHALAIRVRLVPAHPFLGRAARALSERGDGLRALLMAFDAEDDELILRLVSRHLESVFSHHEEVLLRLELIPRARVAAQPLLAVFLALCQAENPNSRLPMLMNHARAERNTRPGSPGRPAGDRIVLGITRSIALTRLGRHATAHVSALAAVDLLDELPTVEAERLLVPAGIVYGLAADTALAGGDVHLAAGLADRAVESAASNPGVRHIELGKAAVIAAVDGGIVAARVHLDSASRRSAATPALLLACPTVVEAVVAIERGDASAARRAVDRLGPRRRALPVWPIAESALAVADALEGRLDLSIGRLRAALAATGAFPLSESDRGALSSLLAIALLAQGDTMAARALSRTLMGGGAAAVVSALAALAAGDPLSVLLAATAGLGSERTIRVRAALFLVRAAAAARLGRMIAARRDATAALALLRDHGLRTPWLVLPPDDRRAVLEVSAGADELSGDLVAELAAMPVLVGDVGLAPRLTARERTVLAGVFARETNSDIAARLGVSPNTVKKQRASLYRKLGVSSWEDAVHATLEHGLLDHEP